MHLDIVVGSSTLHINNRKNCTVQTTLQSRGGSSNKQLYAVLSRLDFLFDKDLGEFVNLHESRKSTRGTDYRENLSIYMKVERVHVVQTTEPVHICKVKSSK
jgi:hypothetical protein